MERMVFLYGFKFLKMVRMTSSITIGFAIWAFMSALMAACTFSAKALTIADPDNLLVGIGLIIGQRTDRMSMRQNTPAVTRQTA